VGGCVESVGVHVARLAPQVVEEEVVGCVVWVASVALVVMGALEEVWAEE
jgi:hypothetical protein